MEKEKAYKGPDAKKEEYPEPDKYSPVKYKPRDESKYMNFDFWK